VEAVALCNLSVFAALADDFEQARVKAKQGLEILEKLGRALLAANREALDSWVRLAAG